MLKNEEAEEYRRQLEARLRARVPEVIWHRLMRGGYVRAVHTGGDEDSWRELMDEAREELRIWRDGASGSIAPGRGDERGGPQEIEVTLDDYTRRRGEVFSEVVAALADQHPGVKRFREAYLDGRFLTEYEVGLFVRTQERALFFKSQSAALNLQDHAPDVALKIHGRTLPIRAQERILKELWELAELLADTYHWKELDTMWFVLTGQAPHRSPLQVTASVFSWRKERYLPTTARIVVEAEVWVDAKHVGRAFREAQRHILGGDARSLPDRTLEVVEFVARHMRRYPEESWNERLKAWNVRCRNEWRYKAYNGLRQVFERFIHHTYRSPNPARYQWPTETPYQQWKYKQQQPRR